MHVMRNEVEPVAVARAGEPDPHTVSFVLVKRGAVCSGRDLLGPFGYAGRSEFTCRPDLEILWQGCH